MIEINQVFYSIFAFFALGLGLNSYIGFKDQHTYLKTEVYWSISVYLFMLSCFSWAVAPVAGFYFLTFANTALVASMAALVFLIRSFNHHIAKSQLFIVLILLVVFGLVFEYLRVDGEYLKRIFLVISTLIFISIFQIIELRGLIKTDQSLNLRVICFIFVLELVFMVLRVCSAYTNPEAVSENIYHDTGLPFYFRMAFSCVNLLVFVFIGNLFYEKVWNQAHQKLDIKEDQMLSVLTSLTLAKDSETGQHIQRTQRYVMILASKLIEMGVYSGQLTTTRVDLLFKAAPLHDIGKVGIPDYILSKPAKLEADEWEIMKTHALIGERVLSAAEVALDGHEEDVISIAIKIAGGHHEKWDGSGYPRGLAGNDIPLEARIMAVADIYDALVCERSYKKKWSHEEAVQEIVRNKNSALDPWVVDAFIAEQLAFKSIAMAFND